MHAVEGVGEGVGAPVGVVGEGERGVRRAARVKERESTSGSSRCFLVCVKCQGHRACHRACGAWTRRQAHSATTVGNDLIGQTTWGEQGHAQGCTEAQGHFCGDCS